MRNVGTLGVEAEARRFADYLLTLEVDAKAEPSGDAWAIWIVDERQVDRGKRELEAFRAHPADPRYRAAEQAASLRREAAARARAAQKNVVDLRTRWQPGGGGGGGLQRLTLWLILSCVAVAIFTDFGGDLEKELAPTAGAQARSTGLAAGLLISTNLDYLHESVARRPYFGLDQIAHGEVWRTVTPIFLHFSIVHLLFNMMAFWALGGAVEIRQGMPRLAALVVASAVLSNLTQYFATGSPVFGGMSGVGFALFGYVWMQSRFAPASGLYLDQRTVFIYLLWFVLCATGQTGMAIANWAHGGGLVFGALAGVAVAKAK